MADDQLLSQTDIDSLQSLGAENSQPGGGGVILAEHRVKNTK